jgi:hypothetical protein
MLHTGHIIGLQEGLKFASERCTFLTRTRIQKVRDAPSAFTRPCAQVNPFKGGFLAQQTPFHAWGTAHTKKRLQYLEDFVQLNKAHFFGFLEQQILKQA